MSYDDYEYTSHASSGEKVSIPDDDLEELCQPHAYKGMHYYDPLVYLLIDEVRQKTGIRFVVRYYYSPPLRSGSLKAAHQYTLYKHVEGTTYRRIWFYNSEGHLYSSMSVDANTVVAYLNGFLNGFLAGGAPKTPAAGVNRDDL